MNQQRGNVVEKENSGASLVELTESEGGEEGRGKGDAGALLQPGKGEGAIGA